MTSVHKVGDPVSFHCDVCEKVFLRKNVLARHKREVGDRNMKKKIFFLFRRAVGSGLSITLMQVHERRLEHECATCDLWFPSIHKLKRHATSKRHIHLTNSMVKNDEKNME